MSSFTDETGNRIEIKNCPQRIISVVPSQTELLHYLGLEDEVKGISKFCIHPPEWFAKKEKIGGTKKLHLDKIRAIQPDLIIANKEENVKEEIEELQKRFPVWTSDIKTLEDAKRMITSIGDLTCRVTASQKLADEIGRRFQQLGADTAALKNEIRAAYLIWQNPYMAAGGDNFINHMMEYCKLKNVFATVNRYPVIELQDLINRGCELLLLSSEPYPFRQKHLTMLQTQLPEMKIILVDGEMFSWYGSRLLKAADYFSKLIRQLPWR